MSLCLRLGERESNHSGQKSSTPFFSNGVYLKSVFSLILQSSALSHAILMLKLHGDISSWNIRINVYSCPWSRNCETLNICTMLVYYIINLILFRFHPLYKHQSKMVASIPKTMVQMVAIVSVMSPPLSRTQWMFHIIKAMVFTISPANLHYYHCPEIHLNKRKE